MTAPISALQIRIVAYTFLVFHRNLLTCTMYTVSEVMLDRKAARTIC